MYEGFETILVERKGPILEIVLNRPEARNAITYQLQGELIRACNQATDDPEVKVITLRGAGKVFCAGHDLKEVASGYATIGRPVRIRTSCPACSAPGTARSRSSPRFRSTWARWAWSTSSPTWIS